MTSFWRGQTMSSWQPLKWLFEELVYFVILITERIVSAGKKIILNMSKIETVVYVILLFIYRRVS